VPVIVSLYHVQYYRNSYDRATLDRARLAHRALLDGYKGKDMNRVATLAYELGMMDAEAARRDNLKAQGSQ